MTKQDLVNDISKSTGIEKTIVLTTIEAFMETSKAFMIKGNGIFLRGFGTFQVKKRAKKTARNITKNTIIIIPAHYVPTFKPAKAFLNKVKTNVKV